MGASLDLVELAAVGRPHGIAGEVRVHPFNPQSDLLLSLDAAWLIRPDGRRERIAIAGCRPHGEALLVRFEGVSGRDAADALKGSRLALPRDALPEAAEDECYHVDLVGLTALDAEGREVGTVIEVLAYPSVDCLLVRGGGLDREVPFLMPYVERLELAERRVVLAHLDDLETRPTRS
ncbi:MAG: ribosome maturation factor RimM [Sandaracinaceae bacterium]